MSIRYRCEECGAVMKIRDSLAGTRGKCPTCRAKFTVPLQSTLTEEEYEAEQSNSSISNGSSLELTSEAPSSPSLQPAPKSSPKLPPAPPAAAPLSSPKLDKVSPSKTSQSSSKLQPVTPPKASTSSTKLPPVTPAEPPVAETIPEPAAEAPAEEPEAEDFDAAAFLMTDDSPNGKKSAGLSKQAPGETKPALDKLGRRYFGASPKAATAEAPPEDEAGASVTTTATLPVAPVREKIDWKATRKRLVRLSPWMLVAMVMTGITYWVSAGYFLPRLPLPALALIKGTVQLDGAGFAGMIVHLTPVNATQGVSTSGQTIRLTDPVGATNENGEYQISYLGQPGSPLGKVRIWLEPVHPVDYKKIPSKYQQPGPDIREVREAGNENKFQLDLKEAK